MHLSREIAGGNGEILELRIGGENVTAHRQMKTHREALISAGEEKKTSKTNLNQHHFPLSKNNSRCDGPIALVSFMCFSGAKAEAAIYVTFCVRWKK